MYTAFTCTSCGANIVSLSLSPSLSLSLPSLPLFLSLLNPLNKAFTGRGLHFETAFLLSLVATLHYRVGARCMQQRKVKDAVAIGLAWHGLRVASGMQVRERRQHRVYTIYTYILIFLPFSGWARLTYNHVTLLHVTHVTLHIKWPPTRSLYTLLI